MPRRNRVMSNSEFDREMNRAVSTNELAALLDVTPQSVNRWVRDGIIERPFILQHTLQCYFCYLLRGPAWR